MFVFEFFTAGDLAMGRHSVGKVLLQHLPQVSFWGPVLTGVTLVAGKTKIKNSSSSVL